jgi:NADPH-dependent 2,4-dienoyl-CoA reductase/sulfur reductase-like enzyme
MTKLLIIGGSDAGISAALRAKELAPETEVTVVLRDQYPNFSICGLPFYLSGEVSDWHNLAHRTAEDISKKDIELLLNHTAESINPDTRQVTLRDPQGEVRLRAYDELIIGTGAVSADAGIEGLDHKGVFTLRWMKDMFAVEAYLEAEQPRSAVIVGGGYIGLEMADAFLRRGLHVRLLEYTDSILTTVDPPLAEILRRELERHGVQVTTGVGITEISEEEGRLLLEGTEGFATATQLALIAVGVRPNATLAASAGAKLGIRGAIQVDRKMATNLPHVYAAGDCAETYHRLLEANTYIPLGTTAHKQGRVAGENAVSEASVRFPGSLGTQAVKVCDLVVARTGLRQKEAQAAGYLPLTVDIETWDHKVYYPEATRLHLRLTGDQATGQLLGAQILGHQTAEVSKRIDILATAIYHHMLVDELSDLDLSYTPPLSSPWDPVQMAAQVWVRRDEAL